MGRQLFLHHYLPAHLASALVTGALLEFVCNIEPDLDGASVGDALSGQSSVAFTTDGTGKKNQTEQRRPITERSGGQNLWISWAVTAGILAVLVWTYIFFAPLTYGSPGLEVDEVVRRKWLSYDLHFAK
jgi:dolichyl-phosphate-mannose-protein mannosyltransferase